MAAFGGLILTNKGRALQAKAQTGVQLNFTRIALGDGELGSSSIVDLNALKNEIKSLSLTKIKTMPGGKAVIGGYFTNQELPSGFYWRELGVFAQDPDVGEVLYCYANASTNAEYIPAPGTDIIERNIDVVTLVGNASSVTATIEESLVFYNKNEELEVDHTKAPTAPTTGGVIGTIQQLFNFIGNRIKAFTGLDWWKNPTRTLEALNTAHDAHKAEDVTQGDNPHGLIYEEGECEIKIYGNSGTGTDNIYSTLAGSYTRINNQVTVVFNTELSSKDANLTGHIRLSGLPFPAVDKVVLNLFITNVTVGNRLVNSITLNNYMYLYTITLSEDNPIWGYSPFSAVGVADNSIFNGTITYLIS